MMKYILSVLLIISSCYLGFSQVGINTTDPDASAALDIVADDSGILIPRMTTLQKTQIANPAHSLLVYDTDLEGYYFNQGTMEIPNWTPMLSKKDERNNYVLVKSVDDLPAAAGGKITLDENTYYEINGTIILNASIDLNDAYVSGLDASEDVLSFAGGTVFAGNTGGNIRNVTLSGAQAFNITGPGISSSSSLLVQNTIISEMASVGQISGLGLFFGNIVQFLGNTNGITYSNIGNLLLNNQGWFSSNTGTYETFTGAFGFIEKVSGFSTVSSGAVGLDVSATNLSVGKGVLNNTVFSGSGTYVNGYVNNTYDGYNFSNDWTVNSTGITQETDDVSSGSMTLSTAVGSGETTSFTGTGTSSRTKLSGTTTSDNLFRFEEVGNNRLVYKGNETRFFNINVSMSYQGGDMTLILYIAKNGSIIESTKVYGRGADGFFVNSGILALPIVASLKLSSDDYVEVWAERYSGSGNIQTVSLSLSIN